MPCGKHSQSAHVPATLRLHWLQPRPHLLVPALQNAADHGPAVVRLQDFHRRQPGGLQLAVNLPHSLQVLRLACGLSAGARRQPLWA